MSSVGRLLAALLAAAKRCDAGCGAGTRSRTERSCRWCWLDRWLVLAREAEQNHRPPSSRWCWARAMAATVSGRSSAGSLSLFSGGTDDAALPGLLVALMTLFVRLFFAFSPLLPMPAPPRPQSLETSFLLSHDLYNFPRCRMATVRTRSLSKSGWKGTQHLS